MSSGEQDDTDSSVMLPSVHAVAHSWDMMLTINAASTLFPSINHRSVQLASKIPLNFLPLVRHLPTYPKDTRCQALSLALVASIFCVKYSAQQSTRLL